LISGSQDAIGIVFPGLNKLQYDNEYWPFHIESVLNDGILDFIEQRLYLIQLFPRNQEFDVLANTNINKANAHDLSVAADNCWNAIINKDAVAWGKASVDSFNAQIKMFPNMVSDEVLTCLEQYKDKALGWKLCGAGGGGYLVLISEIPVENAIKIHIRRP
ncbi:MAG: cytidyltransferase, partial [Bacteroidales bacterium]|nr:cytidyltransferase [Bacteroidales bacterium]